MIPTIHSNGTSRESLLRGLKNASSALDKAYGQLRKTAPNGRDYYLQGITALGQADQEHDSRLRRLKEIKKEIDELAEAVSEQEPSP